MSLSSSSMHTATIEGSALISLGELFKLEERRVEEEQERQRRLREEREKSQRTRIEREKLVLEEQKREQDRLRAERERAEAEDAARVAGAMLGIIARAKVEAEAKELEKSRQAEHAQVMELERLRATDSAQWLRRGLVATAAAELMAVASLLGAYFGSIEPQNERAVAQAQAETSQRTEEARRLQAQLDERRGREAEQAGRLASLEKERDAYKAHAEELAEALAASGTKTPRGSALGATAPASKPPLQKCQYEGDPMCGLEQ